MCCPLCGLSPDPYMHVVKEEKNVELPPPFVDPHLDLHSLGHLFPLPYLHPTPRKPRSRSPRSKARYLRQCKVYEWGRQLVDVLNRWYKGSDLKGVEKSRSRLRHVRRSYRGQLYEVLQSLRSRVAQAVRMMSSRGGQASPTEDKMSEHTFYNLDRLQGRGGTTPLVPLTSANVAIPPLDRRKLQLDALYGS